MTNVFKITTATALVALLGTTAIAQSDATTLDTDTDSQMITDPNAMTAETDTLVPEAEGSMTADTQMGTDATTMDTDMTMSADASDAAKDGYIRTRDITGGNIYRLAVDAETQSWNDNTVYSEVDAEWDNIGEIEDIVLSKDGQMIGVIAEIGGFLDIGDKHVMIPLDSVRLAAVDDETYAYVTNKSEAELESMEEVDEGFWD